MQFRKFQLDWRYGISELLIVVVGVLIALAADGWREERQNGVVEQQYVAALISDLQSDTAAMSAVLQATESRARYGELVLSALDTGTRNATPADFARAVQYSMFLGYPTYSRSTISDLMSTGNLRLIRSPEVKNVVAAYYGAIDRTEQFTENRREIQRELGHFIPELLELEHLLALARENQGGPPWAPAELMVSETEAANILQRLRARPQIRPRLKSMVTIQAQHYAEITRIRQMAIAALGVLDRYLGALQ